MMRFISSWEDAKLTFISCDFHFSQPMLLNKKHGNHRYQLHRIRVAFPLQCVLPYTFFCYIFSAPLFFLPRDCSSWLSQDEQGKCVNGTAAKEGSGGADSIECAFPSESMQKKCLTELRKY